MFVNAVSLYRKTLAIVGGGSDTVKGRIHGVGCQIGPDRVVTAGHVWHEHESKYSWPVASFQDGLHRCEIEFESPEDDLMLLKAEGLAVKAQSDDTGVYPRLCGELPRLGMSVAFLAKLGIEDTHRVCCGAGTVAFQDDSHFVISTAVMQPGFSGSPVFRPDGSLIGVVIQILKLHTDDSLPTYRLPVFSSMLRLKRYLNNTA